MKVLALKRRSPLFPFLDLLTFLELLGEIVVLIQKGGWPGRDQTPEPEGIENQVRNESLALTWREVWRSSSAPSG